eukprot:CAMPEP_0195102678 /NCGR_PEP_ID=MMETSP0448-20130528/68943_1 /TAXON_ID=66468 /ORGANISM="Heterocapsa triquestra, Strain CCMP 448" /LENGTH=62 /DNA_ID=CAMNT_0040138211 /DNA_START=72 /DNA_END=258 /DNA_ORIENTATION=+
MTLTTNGRVVGRHRHQHPAGCGNRTPEIVEHGVGKVCRRAAAAGPHHLCEVVLVHGDHVEEE